MIAYPEPIEKTRKRKRGGDSDFEYKNVVIAQAAPRRSGKSYWNVQYLENYIDEFDFVYIMCPSAEFNEDYDRFEKKKNVYFIYEVSSAAINKIFTEQCDCMRLVKKLNKLRQEKILNNTRPKQYRCPNTLVLLDDVVDSNVISFRSSVDKIAERGRHINLTCIISSQRMSAISRSIRINADYFMIFEPHSYTEIEKFLEEFVPIRYRSEFKNEICEIFKQDEYAFILMNFIKKYRDRRISVSNTDDFFEDKYQVIKFD